MIERQHVWLGPEATTFDEPCEACLALREPLAAEPAASCTGSLRREADVGFTTCRRGHRIVVRRVARELARGSLTHASRAATRLSRVPSTVVVGAQWGDEGKGKIVDLLAQQSDVVCRYQGGPNAGHTIIVGGETFKIRQTPSGVISGKTSVIGAGCVVDPQVLARRARRARGARDRPVGRRRSPATRT